MDEDIVCSSDLIYEGMSMTFAIKALIWGMMAGQKNASSIKNGLDMAFHDIWSEKHSRSEYHDEVRDTLDDIERRIESVRTTFEKPSELVDKDHSS